MTPSAPLRTDPVRRLLHAGATLALALGTAFVPAAIHAQPADLPIPPAKTDSYPPGVSIARLPGGAVYVDRRGRTLYGMDMRTLLRWGPDPAQYCTGTCAADWEPLLAPADARPNIAYPRGGRRPAGDGASAMLQPQSAPDWTIIAGPQGPQWVYKGWHMVFTRRGDTRGSTAFEGADERTWNTLKFIPPVPQVAAPPGIAPRFIGGSYALADAEGRVLFTGTCRGNCAAWKPLAGPMASRGFGAWSVIASGEAPQWAWHGKPVFVSQQDDPAQPPPGGTVLRP